MQLKSLIPMTLGALVAAAGTLGSAAEVKFGGRLGVGFPTSDQRDLVGGKAGVTAGAFALFDLGNGHGVRPRLDYFQVKGSQTTLSDLSYSGTRLFNTTTAASNRIESWSLGVDYVYYFDQKTDQGWYLVAGLGAASNRLTADITYTRAGLDASGTYSMRSTRPYATLGAGYQFNDCFSLEAGYRHTTLAEQSVESTVTGTFAGTTGTVPATFHRATERLGTWTLAATLRF